MLYGRARITAIDPQGRNFVDDVGVGDLWYFPSGIPHSIQGLGPDGCEFLLVFDDGSFDEDNTFLLSDWFKHTPNEVLAKNFGVPASSFGHTPDPSRALHLSRTAAGAARLRPARRRSAGAEQLQPPHDGAGADPHQGRHGAHHRFQQLPRLHHHRRGAGRDRAGRDARAALASEHRRVAVLHRGQGAHGRVRVVGQRAHLRLSGRRRRLRAVRHGPLHREHRRRRRCASSKCSRAATTPTSRSTSGSR